MEKRKEYELTNELLEQVLGGSSQSPFKKIYTFTGKYAAQQASLLNQTQTSGCSCRCSAGYGSGAGAGA